MVTLAQAGVSVQPANAPKVAVPSLENPACSVSAPTDGSQVYCDVPLAASIPLAVPSDAAIPLATQKKNTLLSRSQIEKASHDLQRLNSQMGSNSSCLSSLHRLIRLELQKKAMEEVW